MDLSKLWCLTDVPGMGNTVVNQTDVVPRAYSLMGKMANHPHNLTIVFVKNIFKCSESMQHRNRL
jgi:hypothetical protein